MSASLSVHGDATTHVRIHDYGTARTPILALDGDGYSLTVSVFDSVPLADHLTFARELAAATAQYLTALETYATAHRTPAKAG